MILNIRLIFGQRTHSKLFSDKSIPFVERAGVLIDLQSIQPQMLGRGLPGMLQQGFADPALLIIRMDIQMVDEVSSHCQEGNGMLIHLDHPDAVLDQNMIAEVVLVLIKEMALRALKFRQGFLARNSPENRYRLEVFGTVRAYENCFRHGWKK